MIRSAILPVALALALGLCAGAAQAGCNLNFVELPITMAGLRPLVEARINGTPTTLVVDSGAFYSMIATAAAARLGLHTTAMPEGFTVSGVTGEADAAVAKIKTFTLAKTDLRNIDFIVGGGALGSESSGLLGRNVLGAFDVDYDLANGAMRLVTPKDCGKTVLAYWATEDVAYLEVPMEPRESSLSATVIAVRVNGHMLKAELDTGAPTSVLTLGAARRAGIRIDGPGVEANGLGGGIGARVTRSWVAPVESFEIGGLKVLKTRIEVSDIELGNADMLLGDDFFLSNRVYVANSQRKLYFTYNGGRMFNLRAPKPGAKSASAADAFAGAEPTDADGFVRRGNALLARGEAERAIADLTKAIERDPSRPRYFFDRARARQEADASQLDPALADLDSAIALDGKDAEMLALRAELRLRNKDRAGARADIDAASRIAPAQADLRLELGHLYTGLDQFGLAIGEYDRWIASHPGDGDGYRALNGRCWASALGNLRLDKALADCDTAVRRSLRSPDVLDSRGLLRLRRGEYAKAIADYDAVLAHGPNSAWSLYGRGLARLRTGARAAGEADLAAAAKADAEVPVRAASLGLTP